MRSRDAVQAVAPALIYTLLTNLVYALLASSGLVRSDIMRQARNILLQLLLRLLMLHLVPKPELLKPVQFPDKIQNIFPAV